MEGDRPVARALTRPARAAATLAGLRALLHAVAYASLALLAVFGAYRGWFVLSGSLEFESRADTPLRTPLWIPQALWLSGMVLFASRSRPRRWPSVRWRCCWAGRGRG